MTHIMLVSITERTASLVRAGGAWLERQARKTRAKVVDLQKILKKLMNCHCKSIASMLKTFVSKRHFLSFVVLIVDF
jgi:hypothetical protein